MRLNLYHRNYGLPVWFDPARYTRLLPDVLTGTRHYNFRRMKKRLPLSVDKPWVLQSDIIELQCSADDNAVLRYLVRSKGGVQERGFVGSPYDLSVVIEAATGQLITGWWNREGDQHGLSSERSQQYVRLDTGPPQT